MCYISWVNVYEDFQGEGVGTKAVREVLREFSDLGVSEVYIDCKNEKMVGVVQKLGFENWKCSWYIKKFTK